MALSKVSTNQIDTAATPTVAEATVTGDLTVDTNTLHVDAANNRVGIGTASPATVLHVSGGVMLDGITVIGREQTTYDSAGAEVLIDASASTPPLICHVGGSEKIRFQAAGGISFNGDTAAANALDDYEEGTWTPTADAGITFTGTPSGTYIKIGNLVTVFDSLTCDLTNTQAFTIGGLPFDPAAGNEPVVLILNSGSTFDYVPRGRTGTGSVIKGRSPATVSGINLMIQATYHV